MRPASGSRRPDSGTARGWHRLGVGGGSPSSRRAGLGPGSPPTPGIPRGPTGPAAAGVTPLGSPRGVWGHLHPTPAAPPPAGKVLGINNAHCFPLMNITDLPGRQLRAPAGGAGASPAFPRPGTPLPSPDVPGVPAAARQSEGLAAAFTPLPPWVSLGSWSKTRGKLGGVQGLGVSPGGSLPLLTSPPVSSHGVWLRGEMGRFVLGEKPSQPRGCSEQTGPAEMQGDPSPWPTAMSPARGGARGHPRAGVRPEP